MERRAINDWLPSIEPLTKSVEKVVLCIQGTCSSLNKNVDQINESKNCLLSLEEAIKKRKEELKKYKESLSKCQNTMKTKLQISRKEIFEKMDSLDSQIMQMDQNYQSLSDQSILNEGILKLSNKIYRYQQVIPQIKDEIRKTKIQIKSQEQAGSEYKSYLSSIEQLKEEKKQILEKREQISSQKLEISQINSEIKNLSNDKNIKFKKALDCSISKLRQKISNIDRQIADTEKQKTEMYSLVRESQKQFVNIKKCVNETVSKTMKKSNFILNVVDEMKKLIQIRKDRLKIKKEISIERQHLFDFRTEIKRTNSKITKLKNEKRMLIDEENSIEDQFLKKVASIKKPQKKPKHEFLPINSEEMDYSNNDEDEKEIDHNLIISQKNEINEKKRKNLKLLKSLESTNTDIISLRQKIRETQENIVFQFKMKNEKENLKKDRENHSIFFSFEKILNQIEEKKNSIMKLKQKIKEEKDFLNMYAKLEIIDDI